MKTMIGCIEKNRMCKKALYAYNELIEVDNQLEAGDFTKAKQKRLLKERHELCVALVGICVECELVQRIKIARAELKEAHEVLLAATEALETEEAQREVVIVEVYERLIAEAPELEAVLEVDDLMFDCLLEQAGEWVEYCERVDDLAEEVTEATKALNKTAAVLDKLLYNL